MEFKPAMARGPGPSGDMSSQALELSICANHRPSDDSDVWLDPIPYRYPCEAPLESLVRGLDAPSNPIRFSDTADVPFKTNRFRNKNRDISGFWGMYMLFLDIHTRN